MDPGSLPQSAAPDLATLRRELAQARDAYPALRRGLSAALADIDRALGVQAAPRADQRHNRERIELKEP